MIRAVCGFMGLAACWLLVNGCSPANSPSPPRQLTGETLAVDYGAFSHDLHFRHSNLKMLYATHVTITVYTQKNQVSHNINWGEWRQGEPKVVNVEIAGVPFERVLMQGTAEEGRERNPITIDAEWTFGSRDNE